MKFGKIGLMCASLFLLSAVAVTSFAQGNGAVAAGGGGRRNRQGGQGGGQRRGGGAQITLATIPVATLDSYLKLTAEQKTKITAIQTQYAADIKALAPAAPADPTAQPDRQALQDMMTKRREAATKAESDTKALLTDDQSKLVPDMTKELGAYQSAGIPVGVVSDMKFTADQKTKITTISTDSAKEIAAKRQEAQAAGGQVDRQAMQDLQKAATDKIMAVLTDTQKTTLDAYKKAHPQPQFGGGRNGGGRRPGGAAGAAPPTL